MTVHVRSIEIADSPDDSEAVRLVAQVHIDHSTPARHALWFEVAREYADALSLSGNPWLVALAVPASLDRQPLRVDAPVDPDLYEQVHQLMRIWHTWGWTAQPIVPIEANVTASFTKSSGAGLTGLFFSGGVDSLFSLLTDNPTHYPERRFQIDELLCIWGLNESVADRTYFEHGLAERQQVADATGRSLMIARTNLREVLWRPRQWVWAHPMLMAAVGLALEPRYRRLFMASDGDFSDKLPGWVHPLEVPLFSTRGLEFCHDGGAYTRLEKLAIIADNALVQRVLNVCVARPRQSLNCGQCIKCLRTMAALDLADLLHRYSVFELAHYPHAFATTEGNVNDSVDLRQLVEIALRRRRDDLIPVVKRAYNRYRRHGLTRRERIELSLSEWVMPARGARWVGRAIDGAYRRFVKRLP